MDFKSVIIKILIYLVVPTQIRAFLSKSDEDFSGSYADRYDWTSHPCRRTCKRNEPPKTCYYVFVPETYSTMSKACYDCPRNMTDCHRPHCIPADGIEKSIYVVNRQLPGPAIEVCQNDKIVVEVRNTMLSDSITIHWHGIKQFGTPYMDGVPFVTQCPILPGQRFQYAFNVTIHGTYFWHSHIGYQRVDGIFGALIVRPPITKDIHKELYDHDNQLMVVNDWSHATGIDDFNKAYHVNVTPYMETILVNGFGRFIDSKYMKSTQTPLAVFDVTKNKRHRFRLINAGSEDCPTEISIDNHTMLVISLDGSDIKPVEVDVINIWSGERIDFIVKANKKPSNYWIRLRGYTACEPVKGKNGAYQVAILRYDTAIREEPRSQFKWNLPMLTKKSRVLNPVLKESESKNQININIPSLNATDPNDAAVSGRVDKQFYITLGFNRIDNFDYHREKLYGYKQVKKQNRQETVQLNHLSLKLPSFPLLSQPELIKPGTLCNSSTISSSCEKKYCDCTHVLEVKHNSVIELVFISDGTVIPSRHPMHLHGHFFRVISTGEYKEGGLATVEKIKRLDRKGKIKRKLDHAPIKDTIKVPLNGYTIVRFHANNTGYWLLHCHFESHLNIGMGLIFKVGEHKDFPKKPKNFPTCGNYSPDDHFLM